MNPKASKAEVLRDLALWARELELGEGKCSPLARWQEQGGDGGDGFGRPPGRPFSPRSERTDALLKDMRSMDPWFHQLLVCKAIGYSHQALAAQSGESKTTIQNHMEMAIAAFRFAVHSRTNQAA